MPTSLDLRQHRARDHNVPAKLLLVDDDELELSLMSDRLTHAGFVVKSASNGEEALAILEREWFPIILTDWHMPVMDGIRLIETLRERGGEDSYLIMLSIRTSREDFERGYCAGADDYLSKKCSDTEIMARIEAGLHTVGLRRALRQQRAALTAAQQQAQLTDTDAAMQLQLRLQAEVARARRYRRACSVLLLGIHLPESSMNASDSPPELDATLRADLMQAIHGVLRADIDAVLLKEYSAQQAQVAVVLPETGPAEVAVIRGRVRVAIEQRLRERHAGKEYFEVSIGAASLDPAIDANVSAEQLLATAEQCRRCMASCGARRLSAVQTSVVSHVAIPCRHGYAVADHCLELDHRYADESRLRASSGESAAPSM